MRTPRLAGLSLATMAAVALAVAGCDNGDATPSPGGSATTAPSSGASSGAPDPAAVTALSDAAAKLGQTSFKITVTSGPGFKLTGAIDAPHGVGETQLVASGPNATLNVSTKLIDKDVYVQVPGITKPGTWMHVDASRLSPEANIGLRPGQVDPVRTADLLGSTTDVHSVGSNLYAGSLDLSKAAGLGGLNQVTIDGYGSAAQRVPFTVGLDDQGRVSVLTINLPAVNGQPTQPIEALYTDYGTPVTVQPPAASTVTEAPAELYQALGG